MRVIILTSPHHVYGNHLIKQLLAREDLCHIVGIVQSTTLLPKKTYLEGLIKYLKTAGPHLFFAQGMKMWFFRIGSFIHRLTGNSNVGSAFFSFERLLNPNIPIHNTADINSSQSREFLSSQEPDLFILALFGQILGGDVLSIARLGCVNFHPSLLPRHRGLMPVFWSLSMNEEQTGVSVHFVDKGIDTGRLISQISVPIRPDDSEHSLYARTCRIGADMLLEAVKVIRDGTIRSDVTSAEVCPSYHSVPTRTAVARFLQNGRRFFTPSELFKPFESL